jgi:enamine deaminase RidA (YjgF/YER057c/UK114 family)
MVKRLVPTDQLMKPIAEFSMAQRYGDIIQVGATAGTDPARVLAGYGAGRIDVALQARRMLENMVVAVELLGGTVNDIVHLKGYVNDTRDLDLCDATMEGYFGSPGPSRWTVGSWGFPLPQAAVEADLVAVVGSRDDRHYATALPIDSDGRAVGNDTGTQARCAIDNLRASLGAAGLAMKDVVKLSVTLADLRDLPAFEAAFRAAFEMPAYSLVFGPLAKPCVAVGLEAVAVAGGGRPVSGTDADWAGLGAPAMLAGDHLFISGQIGLEADGTLAPGTEAQTAAAWRRIERLVVEAGMALEDVVFTTNVLTDWRDYRAFNAGYRRFVRAPYPPRTTASLGLARPGALVQVEAIAHRRGRDAQVIEVVPAG